MTSRCSTVSWEKIDDILQTSSTTISLARRIEKNNLVGLEGAGGGGKREEFIKKCWPIWFSCWLRQLFNWNCLKCPEILNGVEAGKCKFPT